MICTYEAEGKNPELILYKKRQVFIASCVVEKENDANWLTGFEKVTNVVNHFSSKC